MKWRWRNPVIAAGCIVWLFATGVLWTSTYVAEHGVIWHTWSVRERDGRRVEASLDQMTRYVRDGYIGAAEARCRMGECQARRGRLALRIRDVTYPVGTVGWGWVGMEPGAKQSLPLMTRNPFKYASPPDGDDPVGRWLQKAYLGFCYRRTTYNYEYAVDDVRVCAVPCYAVFMVLGSLPAWLLFRSIRRRLPYAPGLCQTCGYDLRASKERCPECGMGIPPVPEKSGQ